MDVKAKEKSCLQTSTAELVAAADATDKLTHFKNLLEENLNV